MIRISTSLTYSIPSGVRQGIVCDVNDYRMRYSASIGINSFERTTIARALGYLRCCNFAIAVVGDRSTQKADTLRCLQDRSRCLELPARPGSQVWKNALVEADSPPAVREEMSIVLKFPAIRQPGGTSISTIPLASGARGLSH